MLRRAACTIYLAQESDTLGKDSELASTLAQGKPVIAYIPKCTDSWFHEFLKDLRAANKSQDYKQLLVEQISLVSPELAWKDPDMARKTHDRSTASEDELEELLLKEFRGHYDKRADTLQNAHPLAIQVEITTGVANGVLVVRTLDQCSRLVRSIILNELDFYLDESDQSFIALREKISGSVFRVMTKDEVLTNTFWNFYKSADT